MDVTPLIPQGRKIIQSYGIEGFKVSGIRYEAGVIVLPDSCDIWTPPTDVKELSLDDFSFFENKKDEIDVVLVGTGKESKFLNENLRDSLKLKGLKIEVMDTGAACRTYNVLMAEGRRVAAALMPV